MKHHSRIRCSPRTARIHPSEPAHCPLGSQNPSWSPAAPRRSRASHGERLYRLDPIRSESSQPNLFHPGSRTLRRTLLTMASDVRDENILASAFHRAVPAVFPSHDSVFFHLGLGLDDLAIRFTRTIARKSPIGITRYASVQIPDAAMKSILGRNSGNRAWHKARSRLSLKHESRAFHRVQDSSMTFNDNRDVISFQYPG